MNEEKQSTVSKQLLMFLPAMFLLLADVYMMFLQPELNSFSHVAFGLLSCQILCQIVFHRGEICNGQRARLSKLNFTFILFWLTELVLSLFSNYHYVLTDLICLCGILICLSAWKQPTEEKMRNGILTLGYVAGIFGIILYLLAFSQLPIFYWLQYNLLAQLSLAFALTHLVLVISKNRLQGFITLQPFAFLLSLILSSISSAIWLFLALKNELHFSNEYSLALYFLMPLAMAGIIASYLIRQQKLDHIPLFTVFFINTSLPIWAIFANYI